MYIKTEQIRLICSKYLKRNIIMDIKYLITQKGSAGRIGSVITDLEFEITQRKYKDIYEYCTNCGVCIKRCPAKAINKIEKNNEICSNFLDEIKTRFEPHYGCGKCQTKTPCENQISKI
jgi:epoxyqueuosine reductase QueG